MKVIDGTMMSETEGSEDDKKEIKNLIDKSTPSSDSKFCLTKIEDEAGWTYITANNKESEFLIKYSSCMFDTSILIKFFAKIIDCKEDAAVIIDYEGSEPIFYVTPVNENKIRLIYAHDYDLFLNDDVNEYNRSDYKIECDIIIDKKEILENFYNIFYPFTINYNLEKAYEPMFNLEKGKKYLNEIKAYLEK